MDVTSPHGRVHAQAFPASRLQGRKLEGTQPRWPVRVVHAGVCSEVLQRPIPFHARQSHSEEATPLKAPQGDRHHAPIIDCFLRSRATITEMESPMNSNTFRAA